MKKEIIWPKEGFMLQEFIGLNPDYDTLTLQFLVNRKLADGSLQKTGKPGEFRPKSTEVAPVKAKETTPPVLVPDAHAPRRLELRSTKKLMKAAKPIKEIKAAKVTKAIKPGKSRPTSRRALARA